MNGDLLVVGCLLGLAALVEFRARQVLTQVAALQSAERRELMTLAELQAKVEQITTVEQSAIVLLEGLKAKLDEAIASGDPAAVQAIADELGASSDKLAAAITANTPAVTA